MSIEGSLSHLHHFRVSVWMGKHDLNLLGVEEYLFFKKKKKKTLRKRSDKPVLIVVIQLHRFRVKFAKCAGDLLLSLTNL